MTKRLWRLHSLLGLIGGLFLLVVGISGSALVFADELNVLLHPHLTRVQQPRTAASIDYDRIYAAVRERWPDAWEVRFRRLPRQEGETVQIAMSRNTDRMQADWFYVFVHPYTAEILGEKHALGRYGFAHNPVDWLLWFHYSLHANRIGELIVALMALVLLLSSLTGIWLYRKQFWRGVFFRVRLRGVSWRKRASALHTVTGVWAILINLILALTGFWMTRHVYTPEYYAEESAPVVTPPPSPVPHVPYNVVMAKLREELPELEVAGASAISEPQQDYTVFGRLKGDHSIWGAASSQVTIDGRSGRIKETHFVAERSLEDQIGAVATSLHFGNFGGLPIKLLWCVGGLTPGILALSGFAIWRSRGRSAGGAALSSRKYSETSVSI